MYLDYISLQIGLGLIADWSTREAICYLENFQRHIFSFSSFFFKNLFFAQIVSDGEIGDSVIYLKYGHRITKVNFLRSITVPK